MGIEVSSSKPLPIDAENMTKGDNEKVRVQRKTLLAVLEQCQRALELLAKDYDEDDNDEGADSEEEPSREGSWSSRADPEADEVSVSAWENFEIYRLGEFCSSARLIM